MGVIQNMQSLLADKDKSYLANDNISEAFDEMPESRERLKRLLAKRIEDVLEALMIDTANDHNTNETAQRMAKMFMEEVFRGRYYPAPKVTAFPNVIGSTDFYKTGAISVRSTCSHHFAPILGKCWVGILPGEKLIGLSKFNRIVDWFASRPQIQEELTKQIADYIQEQTGAKAVVVVIEAEHMCMTWRGVREHRESRMTTSAMTGEFSNLSFSEKQALVDSVKG